MNKKLDIKFLYYFGSMFIIIIMKLINGYFNAELFDIPFTMFMIIIWGLVFIVNRGD